MTRNAEIVEEYREALTSIVSLCGRRRSTLRGVALDATEVVRDVVGERNEYRRRAEKAEAELAAVLAEGGWLLGNNREVKQ